MWTGSLGIEIFGAANDCWVFLLIGLAILGCQKSGMEAGNAERDITEGESYWRQ